MEYSSDTRLVQEADSALTEANSLSGAVLRTPEELADIVSQFASSDGWIDRVRLRAEERWYERLYHGPDYDIWVNQLAAGAIDRLPRPRCVLGRLRRSDSSAGSWTPPRDGHDWWVSGMEGNGSADCSARQRFLGRVSHVSRFSKCGFCAHNSCVSIKAMN